MFWNILDGFQEDKHVKLVLSTGKRKGQQFTKNRSLPAKAPKISDQRFSRQLELEPQQF